MDFPVVVTLEKPVTFGSKVVKELRFEREPRAKDLFGLNLTSGDPKDILTLASRLCNEPVPFLGDLYVSDFVKVAELVSNFLLDGQETSTK
jgi:hypothetical protein